MAFVEWHLHECDPPCSSCLRELAVGYPKGDLKHTGPKNTKTESDLDEISSKHQLVSDQKITNMENRIEFLETKNRVLEEVVEHAKISMASVTATEAEARSGNVDCLIDEYKATVDRLARTHDMFQAEKRKWEHLFYMNDKLAHENKELQTELDTTRTAYYAVVDPPCFPLDADSQSATNHFLASDNLRLRA
jgi:hypothetical protein